jgi:hypothetical protein
LCPQNLSVAFIFFCFIAVIFAFSRQWPITTEFSKGVAVYSDFYLLFLIVRDQNSVGGTLILQSGD